MRIFKSKLKFYIPSSEFMSRFIKFSFISIIVIYLLSIILTTAGAVSVPSPSSYGINECEKAAKDVQKYLTENNANVQLVWIQPLNKDGSFAFGLYSAHIIDLVWTNQTGWYYIDWVSQQRFYNETQVLDWYRWYSDGKEAKIFYPNRGEELPFAVIWHY